MNPYTEHRLAQGEKSEYCVSPRPNPGVLPGRCVQLFEGWLMLKWFALASCLLCLFLLCYHFGCVKGAVQVDVQRPESRPYAEVVASMPALDLSGLKMPTVNLSVPVTVQKGAIDASQAGSIDLREWAPWVGVGLGVAMLLAWRLPWPRSPRNRTRATDRILP